MQHDNPKISDPPPSRLKRWLTLPSFVLVGALFVFHFLVIAVELMPDNPIGHQYKYQVAGYLEPFFTQNWNLFAPNPINSNVTLRYRFEMFDSGQKKTTSWLDATTPVIETKHASFWTPSQRFAKFMTSSFVNVQKARERIFEHIADTDSLSADSTVALAFYKKAIQFSSGHRAIQHFALSVFRSHTGTLITEYDSVRARYRIYTARFPRFSERKLDYFDLDHYEFVQQTSDPFLLRPGFRRTRDQRQPAVASQ